MTRKRFIKLAMAAGLPRDMANDAARLAALLVGNYAEAWPFLRDGRMLQRKEAGSP